MNGQGEPLSIGNSNEADRPGLMTRALVLRAEDVPLPGLAYPGTHQRYRFPHLTIEDRRMGPLAQDHVRVRMHYVGICGTDVHLLQTDSRTGYVRSSAPAAIPAKGRILGHEGVGQIIMVGEAVAKATDPVSSETGTTLCAGDFVAFESIRVCGQCGPCQRGNFNQCKQACLLGMQTDGLFATVVDIPATLAIKVTSLAAQPSGVLPAAMVEPAGVAWLACHNARVTAGEAVIIFGAGPIGVFCAMICKLILGARRVVMVEPVSQRRAWAQRWCDEIIAPGTALDAVLNDLSEEFDVVIEASGCLDNVRSIFRRVGPNGRVVLLARSGQPLVIDDMDHLITNAISLCGSRGHLGGACQQVMALHEAGRLPLDAVVTGVLPSLERLAEALAAPDQIIHNHCKLLARVLG